METTFYRKYLWFLLIGSAIGIALLLGINRLGSANVREEVLDDPITLPTPSYHDREVIEKYSSAIGLKSLFSNSLSPEECEIRIWVGFSNFYPRGLILSNTNERRFIKYVTGKLDSNGKPVVEEKREVESNEDLRKLCSAPFVGKLIKDDFPPEKGWGDPDGGSIGIELRRGKDYRTVKYSIHGEDKKGKQVVEHVMSVEKTFDVALFFSRPDNNRQE